MTDAIQSLLQTASAYSVDTIPKLEAHVDAQIAGSAPYDFDANRTLVKLYQFFPVSCNEKQVARILTLSLSEFPSTDFLALLCMIPEVMQEIEPIATVIRCFELLDACKFTDFWEAFKQLESNADLTVDAQKSRKGIISVLALCYRTAPLSVVQSALNSTATVDASAYAEMESVSGDVVTFAATADNTKRHRVFQEGIQFSSVSSFVVASQ